MVKFAHRKKTRAPIQIGVGSNIVVPTQTLQGIQIVRAIQCEGQAVFEDLLATRALRRRPRSDSEGLRRKALNLRVDHWSVSSILSA